MPDPPGGTAQSPQERRAVPPYRTLDIFDSGPSQFTVTDPSRWAFPQSQGVYPFEDAIVLCTLALRKSKSPILDGMNR